MRSPHENKYPWLYGGRYAPLSREYIDRFEKECETRHKMVDYKRKMEAKRKELEKVNSYG
jgi:hypothetical protein